MDASRRPSPGSSNAALAYVASDVITNGATPSELGGAQGWVRKDLLHGPLDQNHLLGTAWPADELSYANATAVNHEPLNAATVNDDGWSSHDATWHAAATDGTPGF